MKIIKKTLMALGFGLIFGIIIYSMNFNHSEKKDVITQILEENCDCDVIKSDISSTGIKFSFTDKPFVGDVYNYELKNCKFDDLKCYTNTLNEKLNTKLKSHQKTNLINLTFKNDCGEQGYAKLKKGKVIEAKTI